MKRISLKLAAGLLSGLMASSASANGLRVYSQDSFAAARGEAFTATADNPSAIYYNPAGITQIDGTELRAGLYSIYLEPTFRAPDSTPGHFVPNAGHTYDIQKHFAAVPQLFVTHTLTNLPVSFGLGMYAPYGGSITWPENTGFRSVAIHGSATYLRLNPVVALKLGDYVSLGFGLSANYARINLEQGISQFAKPFDNYFRFTGDGWAIGGNGGLLVKPCDQLSLGITVRSQTQFTMDGSTTFTQPPQIGHQSIPATAGFTFPLEATFGLSYRPTPKWNVEFDADYTGWDSFDVVTIQQQSAPPPPLQQTVPVKFKWQDSWAFELGATRYFDNGWHVSAGYTYDQCSVPDTFYTPLAADQDRHFFNLGVGRKGKTVDFDITYQFGYGPPHTVNGSSPASTPGFFAGQNANGTYTFISHAILVSAGLRF